MKSKTIAILESRLSSQLAELVSKHGGRPLRAPALAEVPDVDHARLAKLVADLETRPPKVAVFQTGVGTKALLAATDALGLTRQLLDLLARASIVVARGPKPTAVLRSRNVRIDRSAAEPFTTAEVLQAIADVPLRGERVLVQRYGATNDELDRALREMGAEVHEVATYRWALPENTQPMVDLLDALERREVDATVFTSASQAQNLFALAGRLGRAGSLAANLNRTLVASVGPVCSAALRELGVQVKLEPRPPKLGPLVTALDQALSGPAG